MHCTSVCYCPWSAGTSQKTVINIAYFASVREGSIVGHGACLGVLNVYLYLQGLSSQRRPVILCLTFYRWD
jgi:hypothetical protein